MAEKAVEKLKSQVATLPDQVLWVDFAGDHHFLGPGPARSRGLEIPRIDGGYSKVNSP